MNGGVVKMMAVLAVLLLATLGVLLVFDVIPREQFQTLSVKGLMVIGILAAASLAVGLLMKSGNKE